MKKKRLFCVFVMLAMLLMCMPSMPVNAITADPWECYVVDGLFTIYYQPKSASFGTPATIVVPSEINGRTVEALGYRAFQNEGYHSYIDIVIPDTVTRLGREAFYGSWIRNIYVPKSVTKIEKYFLTASLADKIYYQGSIEDLKKINIEYSGNAGLTSRFVCNSNHPEWVSHQSLTDDELDAYIDESGVDPYIYRADYILNSEISLVNMEGMFDDFQSFCSLYKQSADDKILGSIARKAYNGLTIATKLASDPSNAVEYSFKNQHMYEAILFDVFESSVDYSVSDIVDALTGKDARKIVKQLKTEIEDIYNYEFTDSYNDLVTENGMSEETFIKLMKAEFHDEYMELDNMTKFLDNLGKIAKATNSIEETVERAVAFYNISRLTEAEKEVLKQMSTNTSNSDLKTAIHEFLDVIDGGLLEYTNAIVSETVLQKSFEAMSNSLWKDIETKFYTSCPEAYLIKLALNTGLFAGNMLFNADKIVDNYYNLVAAVNTEEVLRATYYAAKTQYTIDKSSLNAQIYNHTIDSMFNMIVVDCDYATKYVNAVSEGAVGNLLKLMGLNHRKDVLTQINSFKSTYLMAQQNAKTNWKYQLAGDYIGLKNALKIDTINHVQNQSTRAYYNIIFDRNSGNDHEKYCYTYNTSQNNWYEPIVKRDGYVFDGWYYDGEGTDAIFDTTEISANTILYAKWKPYVYMISYASKGVADIYKYQYKNHDENATLMPNATKDGYEFVCWNTKEDGSGDNYTGTAVYKGNKNLTLYAIWKKIDENEENINSNTVFTTTADSGYYAETADGAERNGTMAFSSIFDLGGDHTVNISEYGFDLYKDGDDDNKKTLSSNSETELTGGAVKFYATVENIPSSDFNIEISAMPYVVVGDETYTGDVCVYTVTQGGKWLGTKVD